MKYDAIGNTVVHVSNGDATVDVHMVTGDAIVYMYMYVITDIITLCKQW